VGERYMVRVGRAQRCECGTALAGKSPAAAAGYQAFLLQPEI